MSGVYRKQETIIDLLNAREHSLKLMHTSDLSRDSDLVTSLSRKKLNNIDPSAYPYVYLSALPTTNNQ